MSVTVKGCLVSMSVTVKGCLVSMSPAQMLPSRASAHLMQGWVKIDPHQWATGLCVKTFLTISKLSASLNTTDITVDPRSDVNVNVNVNVNACQWKSLKRTF